MPASAALRGIAALLAIVGGIGAVAAQELPEADTGAGEDVDVELVLAVDMSGSVDAFEAQQQREGYLAAITNPSVVDAIQSTFHGKIAVTYVEWSDAYDQVQLVDWTTISDAASAEAFAEALVGRPYMSGFRTSISQAIDFCVELFDDNGYAGLRRVIDISGDGMNNRGRPLAVARADAIARGITINGLPILNDRPQPWGPMGTPRDVQLDLYYDTQVIGGPGAFLVVAESFDAFRDAILSKLIREIVDRDGPRMERFAARPRPPEEALRMGLKIRRIAARSRD